MLRLARARQADPALTREDAISRQTLDRNKPELDVEFYHLSPEALAAELPTYDERRALLAKDPLACSDGFRMLVQLALRHLDMGSSRILQAGENTAPKGLGEQET